MLLSSSTSCKPFFGLWASVVAVATMMTDVVKAEVSLPPLPYGVKELEPYLSRETLKFHHNKHHAKYVATTTSLIAGTKWEQMSLEEIILDAHGGGDKTIGLFNNAAQSWNHAFYWKCMKPNGGGKPGGLLLGAIQKSFGSYEEFAKQFKTAGNTAFGSGWAWLCYDGGSLVVTKTIGAGNPMTTPGLVPILCMDVWEHAYYLDYQNLRTDYVDDFLNNLVNWEFVTENLQTAMKKSNKDEL